MDEPWADDDKRRALSEKLHYEIRMFFASAECLDKCTSTETSRPLSCTGDVTRDMYLESFVVHMRTLLEFLYADPGDKDPKRKKESKDKSKTDAFAFDFIPSRDEFRTWTKHRNETCCPCRKQCLFNRASKELAHLSYCRLDKKQWDCTRIRCELAPIIAEFIELARAHSLLSDRVDWRPYSSDGLEIRMSKYKAAQLKGVALTTSGSVHTKPQIDLGREGSGPSPTCFVTEEISEQHEDDASSGVSEEGARRDSEK